MGDEPDPEAAEEALFKQQFFSAALRAGLPIRSYTPELAVVDYHGDKTDYALHALRARWRQLPADAQENLLYLQLTAPFDEQFDFLEATLDEVRTSLMPRMGPPDARAERNPQGKPPSVPIVAGVLHAYIVVNEPATMWFVTEHHLKRWGTTLEQLLPTAIENLRQRTKISDRAKADGAEAYYFLSGDSYDSARALIVEELLTPVPAHGIVVLLPTREHFLFAPVDGPATRRAMEWMMEIAANAFARAAYPVSDQVFWYREKTWTVLKFSREGNSVSMTAPEAFLEAIEATETPPKEP